MYHGVPATEREIDPGVTLVGSTTGGYSVHRGETYIGWIHASVGDHWRAYVRVPGETGRYLCKVSQDEAVRAIVRAWDDRIATCGGGL